ncbi:MAG TPA: response regulator [Anaerolineae bacterium]|nr:response regulator [Anaerolineae bacterium]
MPTRVLILDSNEAFAMLLKEALEADREFRAVDVSSSQSALNALQSDEFDLAIVDLDLHDMEPAALLRAIRELRPDLPIVVVPIDGDVIPQELAPFDIKGVLTKPFFLPELPARVAEALGRPLPAPAPMPAAAPASAAWPPIEAVGGWPRNSPRALPRIKLSPGDPRVSDALHALVAALNAETVLLTVGDALLAHAGPLGPSGSATLAHRILDSRAVSARSSWIAPTHEQVRFGQSISDSGEHMLYSLDVAEGVLLTVAVRPESPLRLVRSKTRQATDALIALSR